MDTELKWIQSQIDGFGTREESFRHPEELYQRAARWATGQRRDGPPSRASPVLGRLRRQRGRGQVSLAPPAAPAGQADAAQRTAHHAVDAV